MTTWTVNTSVPEAGGNSVGQATYADSGLRIVDTVTGTGASKALLDEEVGSTTAIKIAKLLGRLQRADKTGREYQAYDGVSVTVSALL